MDTVMNNFKKKLGFTLIELMIVIVIIGVLAAISFTKYKSLTTKAKIRGPATLLKHFWELQMTYYYEHGKTATSDGAICFMGLKVGDELGSLPIWQQIEDVSRLRLQWLGVDEPTETSYFWFIFRPDGVIHAYSKYNLSSFYNFSDKECDKNLRDIGMSIDLDGQIYLWGVRGEEKWP
ncbi:prepilin-type N-terminal cleavage/methylation domain-containing protein [bacterium]|nr:prepilin-type N-terminal cleavage/methylation domain-containing protein [bacterium]